MTLLSQSTETIRWILRVLGVFMRARPGITLSAIICAAGSQITRLMAFFMPLKVILLAGNEGVPSYFQFFIEPDDKVQWVIILSIGAILAFVLTLVLEFLTERLAEAGSARVLSGANQIAASRRYREKARNYFAQFCEVAAGTVFAATVLIVLMFFNAVLFGVLVGLVVLEYLAAAAILGQSATVNPSRLQSFLLDKFADYVQICSSFNFLAGFMVILIPFLQGQEGNILVAILSVLMMRQGFNRFNDAVNLTVALSMVRPQIDPLVFRNHRLERTELPGKQAFRVLFSKKRRDVAVQRELGSLVEGKAEFHAEWQDPGIPGVYRFRVACQPEGSDDIRYFQKQVYPESNVYRLEHEELLFEYVSRETLKAPRLVSRFGQGGFECQICVYGAGVPISAGEWRNVAPELFSYFWSVEPPARLVQAYEASVNTLVGRLSATFFEGVRIAVDSDREQDILDRFTAALPRLHDCLGAIPLYVCNPDLDAAAVVRNGDDFYVMSWCRWSLEPIGYALPAVPDKMKLEEMVARVRKARGLSSHSFDVRHVLFAKQCRELDRMIVQENYKKALGQMKSLLDSPVMLGH